jgi:NodT family efflux transporter outer membrane factor (OMF) lipoprotein
MRAPSQFVLSLFALVVAGCAVGPDFKEPKAPAIEGYTPTPVSGETVAAPGTAGAAQRLVRGEQVPAQWWELFRSPTLDQLVRQALAESPTLAAAQATLRVAEENLAAARGALFAPQVDAKASAGRQRFSPAAIGMPQIPPVEFNLYNASVSVGYYFDLFGGARREFEALESEADYQNFQLQAGYVTLTANVVTTAIREAALRAQLAATQDILAAEQRQLAIVERQFALGGAAKNDVLTQRSQVAQTRAGLPALEKELARTRHLLSVYVGKLPSEAQLPEFTLATLELPQALPVSLPSALVRERPDIRAAESLLHRASAKVGVATANQYPQITLTGSYGSLTNVSSDWFSSGTSVWSYGLGLTLPLFRGGQLTAQRRAAVAAYEQAEAQYREVVLRAFQNVADTLRALEFDAQTLKAQAEAASAAREALDLTQRQYELGGATYLALLTAERQHQQAQIGLVQAQAARFADSAALFQALGGGWWHAPAQSRTQADEEKP